MRYDEWRASGRELRIEGRRVFVRERGSGPVLLFLHGFPTTSLDWAGVSAQLEARFRCVAFDFYGFGATEPVARIDYGAQTELTLAVARELGITRAVIVAHDYGVSVAEELLARKREGALSLRVDGVVFLNGGVDPGLHRALPIQRLLAGPVGRWVAPLLVTRRTFERSMGRIVTRMDRFDVEDHWRAMTAHGAAKRAHYLLHYIEERRAKRARWVEAFEDRATPIALAWGERDPVSGGHVLAWARGARPDADVLALEVGHYPQVEAEDEVSAFVAGFAERVSA